MDPTEIVRVLVSMMKGSSRDGPTIEELIDKTPDSMIVKPEKRSRDVDSRPYRLEMEDVMGYMLIGVLAMLFIVLLKMANRLG